MAEPHVAVVFHSVCANTYLLAKEYQRALEREGARVSLWRLFDPNYAVTADAFPSSREYKEEILAVPLLESPAQVLECDALFLGSPTYFGNVSAPVKTFMDSFVDYWVEARLAGKWFGSFATAGTPYGGADFCLLALNTFAQHMGMVTISVPSIVTGSVQPAYGIAHYSGDNSDQRPGPGEWEAIETYCAYAMSLMMGKERK